MLKVFFLKGVCLCMYRPTERERTERLIKMRLREIMMQKDLENVTCKEVRGTYMKFTVGFGIYLWCVPQCEFSPLYHRRLEF